MNDSTIAAISTPNAPGGIGIIRISGPQAVEIASAVFKKIDGKPLEESKGYRAHYGYVICDGKKADEAVTVVYRAPHSYTGEDVAEICCHGGLYITKQVLRAAIEAGAVPAQAGEFTKRAFLNGKIDLAESESVMSLISASGKKAAAAAVSTLEGKLSREIGKCCEKITSVCASLAAWVDYPDEDIEEIGTDEMLEIFKEVKADLEDIVARYDSGRAVTDGVDTVIVGKPNVGKSAIMNMLTGFDRSIVTEFAGTTRDVVEEKIVLGDIILRVADTAGIHETDNAVENIGVELAKKRLERADLVLAVFDGSQPLSGEDYEIIKNCAGKKKVAIINKADLPQADIGKEIEKEFDCVTALSALTGKGAGELEKTVSAVLMTGNFDPDAACLTGERQRNCCIKAVKCLEECIDGLNEGVTLDAVNVCADSAIDALLELTGEKAAAAVVDEVFSKFCVGK